MLMAGEGMGPVPPCCCCCCCCCCDCGGAYSVGRVGDWRWAGENWLPLGYWEAGERASMGEYRWAAADGSWDVLRLAGRPPERE